LLCVSLYSIPETGSTGIPKMVPIRNSLYKEDSCEICLIVRDKLKAKLIKEELPNIKKILELDTIRTKYHRFDARRKLLGSYDLFLCDHSIKYRLRALLGKSFMKSKRFPIPIRISERPNSIIQARDSTVVHIPTGTLAMVRIGKLWQSVDQVTENIVQGIIPIVKSLKKKWSDVQSLTIRTDTSIGFPIYFATEKTKRYDPRRRNGIRL